MKIFTTKLVLMLAFIFGSAQETALKQIEAKECFVHNAGNEDGQQENVTFYSYSQGVRIGLLSPERVTPSHIQIILNAGHMNPIYLWINENASVCRLYMNTSSASSVCKQNTPLFEIQDAELRWQYIHLNLVSFKLVIKKEDDVFKTVSFPWNSTEVKTVTIYKGQEAIDIVFNCLKNCIIYYEQSVIIKSHFSLDLDKELFIYLTLSNQREESRFVITFLLDEKDAYNFTIYDRDMEPSGWTTTQILRSEGYLHVNILKQEVPISLVVLKTAQETHFRLNIKEVWGIYWTVNCKPSFLVVDETVRSMENNDSFSGNAENVPEENDEEEGKSELAAWIIAGLALTGIIFLGLALCTSVRRRSNGMSRRPSASISFMDRKEQSGPVQKSVFFAALKEAEESSEPPNSSDYLDFSDVFPSSENASCLHTSVVPVFSQSHDVTQNSVEAGENVVKK